MSTSVLAALVQHLPDGIIILNTELKLRFVNQFICRHSGKTEQALVGQGFFSMFPEVPTEWFARKAHAVLTTEQPEYIGWRQRLYLLKFPHPDNAARDEPSYMAQNCTLMPVSHPVTGERYLGVWIQNANEQATYHAQLLMAEQQLALHKRLDSLTGLLDRQYWQQQLSLEIARAERYERPITILLFDIDRFKALNDQLGHLQGDRVLRTLANAITSLLRENDLLARCAGAAFALALPDTALDGAVEVANRLKRKLSAMSLLEQYPAAKITISIGLSAYQTGLPVSEWIQRAEDAVYQAKRAGKNQIAIWGKHSSAEG